MIDLWKGPIRIRFVPSTSLSVENAVWERTLRENEFELPERDPFVLPRMVRDDINFD